MSFIRIWRRMRPNSATPSWVRYCASHLLRLLSFLCWAVVFDEPAVLFIPCLFVCVQANSSGADSTRLAFPRTIRCVPPACNSFPWLKCIVSGNCRRTVAILGSSCDVSTARPSCSLTTWAGRCCKWFGTMTWDCINCFPDRWTHLLQTLSRRLGPPWLQLTPHSRACSHRCM